MKTPLSKQDIKLLILVRNFVRAQIRNEEVRARATTITEVNQSQYIINKNSIECLILKTLHKNSPLHINQIIENIEKLGWVSKSIYHKYSQVSSALKDNYYMFERVGRATYKLREGFAGNILPKPIEKETKKEYSNHIPTMKDIVVGVVKKYQNQHVMYPSAVHDILNQLSYDCSYNSVYKMMQDEKRFARNGFSYSAL